MKKTLNSRGTQYEKPKELHVDVDTVYSRTNIKRIETDDFTGWEYDEIQFSIREFQESLGVMTSNLAVSREIITKDVDTLGEQSGINTCDLVAIGEAVAYILEEIENIKGGAM